MAFGLALAASSGVSTFFMIGSTGRVAAQLLPTRSEWPLARGSTPTSIPAARLDQ